MAKSKFQKRRCPNCGRHTTQAMGVYGTKKLGKRRRFHCIECGQTFTRPADEE